MADNNTSSYQIPKFSSTIPGTDNNDYVSIYTPQEDPYAMIDLNHNGEDTRINPISSVSSHTDDTTPDTTVITPNDDDDTVDYVIGSQINKTGPQKDLLVKTLDKYGITGEKRKFLLKTAYLESGYRINAMNRKSSASGWFQFIDSTRSKYSNLPKYQFLSSPDAQVMAASKYYDTLKQNLADEGYLSKAKSKGITNDEAVSMSWLNGKWAKNFIDTGKNTGTDASGSNTSKYLEKYRSARHGGKLEYVLSHIKH